jgi:cytochrome b involved in lipid metabolism
MSKQFTANEVKEAGSVEKGLHIIIDNNVYEMGSFVDEHPGGAKILKRVGGKDASKQFWKVSGARILCGLGESCRGCYWLRFVAGSMVSKGVRHR